VSLDPNALRKQMRIMDEFRQLYPYITVESVAVFVTVARLGRSSSTELATAVGSTRSSANRFLQHHVEHGLMAKREDPLDRRNSLYQLTPKGRQLANLICTIINAPSESRDHRGR